MEPGKLLDSRLRTLIEAQVDWDNPLQGEPDRFVLG
jgi:hypothetical protein